MTREIRTMRSEDWPQVRLIYQEGIATGDATFESTPPKDWEAWGRSRIASCCLVADSGSGIKGWAALCPVSDRCVYGGVGEVSVYVSASARGRGLGASLLRALIRQSEANGIWTLQAGIFPENKASIRLHLNQGFREIGRRERIGRMSYGPHQGRWRDVVLLERRSPSVGVD